MWILWIPRNMPDGVATVCNPSGGMTLGSRVTCVRDERNVVQEKGESARSQWGQRRALQISQFLTNRRTVDIVLSEGQGSGSG